ncbi:hypothetical protein SAMN05216296_0913 [Pseudomonas pohangensis]|jgi:hypothetical protein|uniref:Uncharacterized protein n=1 Tax=Pseudomonas pohangensis TaxID=364197 RepID=A0A1H2EMC3_9PSED|nr:hypothetical protein [Pseudomonas pohangensis]SDT96266.1 hypothetical protein SAMN05216296_0913 [Pseudomonas pohangensis]
MSDPRNRGAAAATPTTGEGCLRRFDPDAVSEQHGADFTAAAALWQALQSEPEKPSATAPASPDDAATKG